MHNNNYINKYYMDLATGMLLMPLCIDPLCKMSSSAQGIYSLMSNISSFTTYPNIVLALKNLDLEASIKVLEKYLKELTIKNKTKTIEECINSLRECILDIEKELSVIHEKLAYNSSIKYLSYFRTHKFASSIDNITVLKNQLDNRTKLFFKILKSNNLLSTIHGLDPEISVLGEI